MAKYIDADAYIKYCDEHWIALNEDAVNAQPAVDVLRWIPVTERLPKHEKTRYWICTDTGYQCECRWTDNKFGIGNLSGEWGWSIFDTPQYSKVIAWMPLPEPYKEGEEE